ncbi:magnesium transporter CorA family protein [Mariniluteicoccus endophyticus]
MSARVRIVAWRDGHQVDCPQEIEAVHGLVTDPETLVWVDLDDSDPAQLAVLADQLGLDRHALEDAVAPGERPKATRHRSHTFFTAYGTRLGDPGGGGEAHDSRLHVARVSGFVLPTALLTIRPETDGAHFDTAPVEARWAEDPALLGLGPGALVHGLLDVVVDGHFDTIQQMDDAAEDLEDELFAPGARSRRQIQQRVYRLRKELVELRRVVLPMREVVNAVMRFGGEHAHGHELDGYYQDLYDHVMRASEWTESLRDVVGSIFETNLSLQDAQLNLVMKKLAGWAAVIAVPTAITGWFGQNVPFPGDGQPIGVYFSLGAILVSTVLMYAALKKADWI